MRTKAAGLLAAAPLFLHSLTLVSADGHKFDPYQLNGGLVTAIAAKDFVVVASDTRFMGEGGYDIVSRDHTSSRLWLATGPDDRATIRTTARSDDDNNKYQVASFSLPHENSITMVGSAGCNADCEQLKRIIRMDLRSSIHFGECGSHSPPVDQVATLLSQVLYQRRAFPYYAFCVAAGFGLDGQGQAFVYDAIGSFEPVAVASAGTGRELLQPILDRRFRTAVVAGNAAIATTVPTLVECSPAKAVAILVDAYRAVAEREIGVGDNVLIWVLQRRTVHGGTIHCTAYKVPLKQH